MPVGPIVDSHVHLWDPTTFRMPWLDGQSTINEPRGLDDYDQATKGLDIESIVYLQVEVAPAYSLLEARDIATLARTDGRIKGIVAWAPLEYGNLARYFLQEMTAISPLIKGIRRLTQGEPDDDFCLQPAFIEGVRLLPEYGLTCDLCCQAKQLGQHVELVRRCPETQFILDHIGKPNIRDGQFEPWASQMQELAELPNVVCKISGVATEATAESWEIDGIRAYVLHVFTCFGEDRVVFGSDWPVATLATTYRRWVETLDELMDGMSDDAKRKFWSGNATRFYRL